MTDSNDIEHLAIALFWCSGTGRSWSSACETEKETWHRRAIDTLRGYGILRKSAVKNGRTLYVYRIPGKQDRVAWGTNAEAMIYLRMLRAIYLGVSMDAIADDGRFSFHLADVCWSASADEALEPGWVA